jgi:hypothetical protein
MTAEPSLNPQRRAYFLSGFDPRGGAHYYRLFAEQLRFHGQQHGRALQLGRRRSHTDGLLSRWTIREGQALTLELGFLHWDDIARSNWPRQPLALIRDALGVYRWYGFGGGYRRIARWSPSVALCGLYPFLFFALALLAALAAAMLVAWGGALLGLSPVLRHALAVSVALLLLWQAWRLAEALGVVWLFRSIRFTHNLGQARDHELRQRVRQLAQRLIALEHDSPASELLLVGHSSGSFVMVMLAAELRRQPEWQQLVPRLRLLSLGQNLANLAVHNGAGQFHQDLIDLAADPRADWLDVTSRDDYLCFAGVDPYRSCGLPLPEGAPYPRLRLIDLARPRGIAGWWQLMGCQFDLHFDYLRSLSGPGAQFNWWELLLEPVHG